MNMIFTNVGLDEVATLIAAGSSVQITELAIGTSNWTPDETATALQTELKRLSVTGDKTSDSNIHLTAVDATTEQYTVFELGIYLSSGTLLAIFADGTAITGKASRTDAVYAIDLPLAEFSNATVVIGGTGFMLPQSTESVAGLTRYSTKEEAKAGKIGNKSVTPEALDYVLSQPRWHFTGARDLGSTFQIIAADGSTQSSILQMKMMSSHSFIINTGYLQRFDYDGSAWLKVGPALNYPNNYPPTVAVLSNTDMAIFRPDNGSLYTKRFDGITWTDIGNSLLIYGGQTEISIAALSSNTVAIINNSLADLRCYEFDGTDWAQIGNTLILDFAGGNSKAEMSALTSNRIAVTSPNNVLVVYEFDGADWAQTGNPKTIPNNNSCSIAAVNSTDVAVLNKGSDDLRVYRFNDTEWLQQGRSESIDTGDDSKSTSILAISGNELLVFLERDEMMHHYEIKHAPALPPSPAFVGL